MATYIVRELQNPQSKREGIAISADSLTAAKRKATRSQMFLGTCLAIEATNGVVLSRKIDGKWEDCWN